MGTRILLQTTIARVDDDWHVGRFSLLARYLGSLPGVEVVSRNLERGPDGNDPVLSDLAGSSFDQLWVFAVDVGDGLSRAECAGLSAFRHRGGGVLTARDHQDLGCSLLAIDGIGSAHYFHSQNPDPREDYRRPDDTETGTIAWPNFHSGRNGDVQRVEAMIAEHPLLIDEASVRGVVEWLPAHPHEGSVGVPADDPGAQVIAAGWSIVSGRRFNLIVAGDTGRSRWIAESSFHHFADYNWDISTGAPSFVSEPPGDQIAKYPALLDGVRAYTRNAVSWLAAGSAAARDHQVPDPV